ncbi:FecR domain-containing protein [Sulfidibacter corallicola]|uniref:FecR domain-containing protein n=1 Tax=Sulfidibacter corallicola TaxID=2818388 RepID=A0A8A4TUS9_SULCO|nr:FecR domain-containing protein [Sulfidibacter corallicola]QTD52898.1 FecR domain-containing protein [Sulfidibacter corallicola]
MKGIKVNISSAEFKKWGIFLVFLFTIVIVYMVAFKPKGEREARELVDRARATTQEARIALQTNEAVETNSQIENAVKALEKAQSLIIESDFTAARLEAERALRYANNVLEKYDPKKALRSKVQLTEVASDVQVRKSGENSFQRAAKSISLAAGDRIQTGSKSACKIVFMEGMEVIVHPNTLIKIDESFRGASARSMLNVYVDAGSISVQTSSLKEGERASISTEYTSATLYANTETLHHAQKNPQRNQVSVRKGRVDMQLGRQSFNLIKDQRITALRDQPEGAVVDLLPAPTPSGPANFAKFTANANSFASVTFSWDGIQGADSYDLEISRDPFFLNIFEERREFPGQRVVVPNLQPGTYYWRLTSNAIALAEGIPGSVREFSVSEATATREVSNVDAIPPSLNVTEVSVQGYLVIIQGNSERDALVRINDEKALLDEYTGDFSHAATMPGKGIYTINVVAEDRAGNRSYEAVKVEIRD